MRRLIVLVFILSVCSCARRGLPPGGPIDLEPPRAVSSVPDSGAVRVLSTGEICVTFSEPMDKRSVRDAVVIRPRVEVDQVRWEKTTFCLELTDSLLPSTTYAVLVMIECRDAHSNNMKTPRLWAFSTGDSLMAGTIRGKVELKGVPAPGIPVWAFDSLKTPAPNFTKDEPDYVSQSGADGAFELIGLPSGIYLLFAFKDNNLNRAYDEGVDFVSPAPSGVVITPEEPETAGIRMTLVNPNEPGSIQGKVEHCYPDSIPIVVRAVLAKDTLRSFSVAAKPDSSYSVTKLPAGTYTVDCFADLNSNHLYDASTEPRCEDPHTVQVFPGEVTEGVMLRIVCALPAAPMRKEETK